MAGGMVARGLRSDAGRSGRHRPCVNARPDPVVLRGFVTPWFCDPVVLRGFAWFCSGSLAHGVENGV